MNKIPTKIFVLIRANKSKPFDSFIAKIWVTIATEITKTDNNSYERMPIAAEIIVNQNEIPVVTATALNLGDDNSILNRIDKSH